MFKGVSQNAQRRVDALIPKNFMTGEPVLTPEEKRANLVAAVKALDAAIQAQKDPVERKAMGLRKLKLQDEISAMRPARRGLPTVPEHFVEVAREMLTKPVFAIMMSEASERAKKAQEP